jgi:HEAT repeat protein
LNAFSTGFGLEINYAVREFFIQVIKDAPTSYDSKCRRLNKLLEVPADGRVKANLIRTLGEITPPALREELLAVLTKELIATRDAYQIAPTAAGVIKQFGYRKAIPDLIKALQTVPSDTAAVIAGLLRELIPANEQQERENIAALVTGMLEKTMGYSTFPKEAAAIIKDFGYRKACQPVTKVLYATTESSMAEAVTDIIKSLQCRESLPTVTQTLCTTTNSSIGQFTADVIKTLQYREALPALREAIQTAPIDVSLHMASVLVTLQDKDGVKSLRERIGNDKYTSNYNFVSLGRALYELQGEQSLDLLIGCFKDAQISLQTYWIDFFKEKRIVKAREAVQSVRDTTTNDSVRQKANEFLSAVQ